MSMSFPQFVKINLKRNAHAYFAYFISNSMTVMIFFSFAIFAFHPEIGQIPLGFKKRAALLLAEFVIFLFAMFFVAYSTRMFVKSRHREFGLLLVLGAHPRQIGRLVRLESMAIGTGAILIGMAGGLLLSKLFLLIAVKNTDMRELSFYWPILAIWVTIVSFSGLFAALSWFTLLLIRKSSVKELLQGSGSSPKEPAASITLSLTGIALLAGSCLLLQADKLAPKHVFLAAALGIAGTYLFYSQLSVLMIRLLMRSRKAVWRGINLLWLSEMAYKLKDNARILFLVTVVTSIACMSVSIVLSLNLSNRDSYRTNPFAFQYFSFNDEQTGRDLEKINRLLEDAKADYQELKVETSFKGTSHPSAASVEVIAASSFNKLAAPMNLDEASLADGQAILVRSPGTTAGRNRSDQVILHSGPTLHIAKVLVHPLPFLTLTNMLVVNDSTYQSIKKGAEVKTVFLYYVPTWNSGQLPEAESPEAVIGGKLEQRLEATDLYHPGSNRIFMRAREYWSLKQAFSLFCFIGFFVALIFSAASASFLYFKLHSDLASARDKYRALSKLGLSERDMGRAATRQIGLLFFVPVLVSSVQTLIVMRPILETMYVYTIYEPILATSALFLGAQTLYFFLVRSRYLRRLKKMTV
ncbi:ABC transporter permease YxdM [Paenibacillus vulneris]|uniref:FtsX-like permease family protein n=1 Tax=Paenibacillus vulneris TaxID=1133364 RepID=A0ABW3V0I3_9BACL